MLDMIEQKPFNIRLKRDYILSKLVAIESDLTSPSLGLSLADSQLLIKNVSVVFHVAASVKFEAPFDVNIEHNVVATKQLLEFAKTYDQLVCFVHVSTAYSNCQLLEIDERVYPMHVPQDLVSLKLTPQLLDNRPNSYTFTKALAENVVSQYSNCMNIAIVRPSIVMSAMKEPAEGWVDTINGPVGLSVLGALGILQKIKVNSEVVFDLIPVDIVSNALICIAWAMVEHKNDFKPGSQLQQHNSVLNCCTAISSQQINQLENKNQQVTQNNSTNKHKLNSKCLIDKNSNEYKLIESQEGTQKLASHNYSPVRVFNLTTGTENPCSFYQYFSIGREEAFRRPSVKALRPLLTIPKQKGMNPIKYFIYKIFSHLLFGYIADTLLGLLGHKKLIIKAVNRMHHANEMFDYFCSNQWQFKTDNVKKLRNLQSIDDKKEFDCDVRAINWKRYAQIGWIGCRRFVLKEDDSTFEWAKKRYSMLCILYYSIKIIWITCSTLIVRYLFYSQQLFSAVILVPIYAIVYLI